MASPSDIESTPPPAVSSLRSKFEQLALDTSHATLAPKPPSSPKPQTSRELLKPDPSSPRPRTQSIPDDLPASPARHIRGSSSSSDIRVALKRPPPPPPPARGMKAANSPAASPLLRPVPAPHSGYASDASTSSISSIRRPAPNRPGNIPIIHLDDDAPDTPPSGGVASLLNKFSPASPSSARPNGSMRITSQPNLVSTTSPPVPPRPGPKPAPPPRPVRHSFPSSPTIGPTNSPTVKVHGPFSDSDSDTETVFAPKAISPYTHDTDADTDSLISFDASEPPSSSSSRVSSETDLSAGKPLTPPRPIPPRPPPRHRSTIHNMNGNPSSPSSHTPPPLPSRRQLAGDDHVGPTPPHRHTPVRHFSMVAESETHANTSSAPPAIDTKSRLPPPPTRTIAPGAPLPPARRAAIASDESDDSGADDDDPKAKAADTMPDTSHSSRKAPALPDDLLNADNVSVPAHHGYVVTSGRVLVVATHGHVRAYDLATGEQQWLHDARTLGLGGKELRATALALQSSTIAWVGTKDGHLIALDLASGASLGSRLAVHTHAVTHILRHGHSMVSLDDTGKALVFDDGTLAGTAPPRVVRIADKQDFAQIFAGKLWTSARESGTAAAGANGAGSSARGPLVRVYDIFVPGSAGRSLLPSEHIGAVTAGAILPASPGQVFLGHEGGFVSVWAVDAGHGVPACTEVIRVSVSDVLGLVGVHDRLWLGGRKGTIAAYDVSHKPWMMTNMWNAHAGLPVQRIAVDPYSIDALGKLVVYSVGRDERVRFWDGLLSADWVVQELLKRERTFSTLRSLNVLIISWNVDAAKPDTLSGNPANMTFLADALKSVDSPDIIVFGFQELIDLESRKMAAKTVLLKRAADAATSEKVTSSYRRWYDKLVLAVRLAMPPETPYTAIHTESLVGLFSCIFVKNAERVSLRHVAVATVKRGMGGRYGNKGGIVARMTVDDSSICFINCHLAAGQHHVRQRNGDIAAILEEKAVFPENEAEESLAYVGGGDGSMVLDHELVFLNGDMNYRIDQRREAVIAAIKAGDFRSLVAHDQLMKEMKFNRGFRLRAFQEGPLTFAPTYKYDRRTNEYDSSEKRRVPAWCDRVLWRAQDSERVQQLHYQRYEADVSDHRPISAGFRITVKSVRHDARAAAKADVERVWVEHQRHLLAAVKEFYVGEQVIAE